MSTILPGPTVPVLQGRFRVEAEVGRGGQARTFRGTDLRSGQPVAIKELDVRRLVDWKGQELFEREAEALKGLTHPCIPRYVDAFAQEDDEQVRFFLVQEFVDGVNLADELAQGRRWSEAEAVDDMRQVLAILDYLHGLSPPVIHRDLKPSNIMRRSDGRLVLIDFGAVQTALPVTAGGSTVVGTPGYMPIEQMMGRAQPATDLYGLGATMVHLLSRVPPVELPLVRSRVDFRGHVAISELFAEILEAMLAPNVEERVQRAADVLAHLDGAPAVTPDTQALVRVGPPVAPVKGLRYQREGDADVHYLNGEVSHGRWTSVEVIDDGANTLFTVQVNTSSSILPISLTALASMAFLNVILHMLGIITLPEGLPFTLAFGGLIALGASAKLNNKMRHQARLQMSPRGFWLERSGLFRALPPVEGTMDMLLDVEEDPKGLRVIMPAGSFAIDAVLSGEQAQWLRETMKGYARRYEGDRRWVEEDGRP